MGIRIDNIDTASLASCLFNGSEGGASVNVTNSKNILVFNSTTSNLWFNNSINISIINITTQGVCLGGEEGPPALSGALTLYYSNNTLVTNSTISCSSGCCVYPIELDNQTFQSSIYNNHLTRAVTITGIENDCLYQPSLENYAGEETYIGLTSSSSQTNNNTFNTTKQTGSRIFLGGTKIGGNFYEVVGCGAYGISGNTGVSYYCSDLNKDGICDENYSVILLGSCSCPEYTNQEECEAESCTWDIETISIDYLPLSDEAKTFTIRTFDESTGLRIYFLATIANSTNTTNTGYQYEYEESTLIVPNGEVSVIVSNSSYYSNTYVGTIVPNTTSTLDAYLQPTDNPNVHQVSFVTVTPNNQALPGTLVTIARTVGGSWATVGRKYTDSTGIASFYMDSTVQYQVTAFSLGQNIVVQSITPTQDLYSIIMWMYNKTSVPESTYYDIQWDYTPQGPINEMKFHNFTYSTHSDNGFINWTAWSIYNNTALIHFENNSNPYGTRLSYYFQPGRNANITVIFYVMRKNMSDQRLGVTKIHFIMYYWDALWSVGRDPLNTTLYELGKNADKPGYLSSFTISLLTLIVATLVSGWTGGFGQTLGQLTFLVILSIGLTIGSGFLISGAIVLASFMVIVGYNLLRFGG
jgi:hypothetical protein